MLVVLLDTTKQMLGKKSNMSMKKKKHRKEIPKVVSEKDTFIRCLVNASPLEDKNKVRHYAIELWLLRRRSNELATFGCNRELTALEITEDQELDKKVDEIGLKLGLESYRQKDPRCWTIRVVVGRDFSNSGDYETTGCG